MDKIKVLYIIICLVIFASCTKKNETYRETSKIVSEMKSSKTESANIAEAKRVDDETLSRISKYVVDYYKFRTKAWVNSLYELYNAKELREYLSEYFESHGVLKNQNIYIVDDNYRIGEVELLPQRTIGFKNNESIISDVYRVEVINSIIGEVKDNKVINENKPHVIYIFIINQDASFKVIGDQDIRWYENQEGLKLANVYVFKSDVLKILKK